MRARVAALACALVEAFATRGPAAAECGKLEGPIAVFSYFSEAGGRALLKEGKHELKQRGIPPSRVYMGHFGTGYKEVIQAADFRFAPVLSPPGKATGSFDDGLRDGRLAGEAIKGKADAWQFNEISHSASSMAPKSNRLDPNKDRFRFYLAGFIEGLRTGSGTCGFVFIDRPRQFARAMAAERNPSFDRLSRSVKRSAYAVLGEEYPEFIGAADLQQKSFLTWMLKEMNQASHSIQRAVAPYVAVITPGFIRYTKLRRVRGEPCQLDRKTQRLVCPCTGKPIPLGGEPPGENADPRGHARRWRKLYIQGRVRGSVAGGAPLAGLGAWAFRDEEGEKVCDQSSEPKNEDPAIVKEVAGAIADGLNGLLRR